MKHLQTFENYTEEEKAQYDSIISNQEELETSTAFEEMPENEQEILSDAYNKESETIQSELESRIETLTKYSTLDELFSHGVLNEVDCTHLVDDPLAPEVEYPECTSAMTFDDVMKPFISKIKWISAQAGEAYSLNSFLTRWVEEYKDYQERAKGISL